MSDVTLWTEKMSNEKCWCCFLKRVRGNCRQCRLFVNQYKSLVIHGYVHGMYENPITFTIILDTIPLFYHIQKWFSNIIRQDKCVYFKIIYMKIDCEYPIVVVLIKINHQINQ